MNRQTLLLIALIALNFADVATTLYGLRLGGVELNPLFRMESLPVKVVLPFVYASLFLFSHRFCQDHYAKGLRILDVNLAVLIMIYVVIVANNLVGIMVKLYGR